MANDLDTTQRATIDTADDFALSAGGYTCESEDEAILTVGTLGGYWYIFAQAVGVTTVNATRLADGATGTMEVTVTEAPGAPDPGTFTIKVGAKSPK
jgi:hypothetical protein